MGGGGTVQVVPLPIEFPALPGSFIFKVSPIKVTAIRSDT